MAFVWLLYGELSVVVFYTDRKWLENKASSGELSTDNSSDPESLWQEFCKTVVESAGSNVNGDKSSVDIPHDEFGNILPIQDVFGGVMPKTKDDCIKLEENLKVQEKELVGNISEQKERLDLELLELEKKEEQYKSEVSKSLEMAAEKRKQLEQLEHRENQLQYFMMVTRQKMELHNPSLAGQAALDSGHMMKRAVSSPGLSLDDPRQWDKMSPSGEQRQSTPHLRTSSTENVEKPVPAPSASLTKKAADVTARLTANIKAKQPVQQQSVKDKSRGRSAEKTKSTPTHKPPTNKSQPSKQNKPTPLKDNNQTVKKGKLSSTRRSSSSLADIPEPIAEETGEDVDNNDDADSLFNLYPRQPRHWSVERVQQISESFKKADRERDKSPLVLSRGSSLSDKSDAEEKEKPAGVITNKERKRTLSGDAAGNTNSVRPNNSKKRSASVGAERKRQSDSSERKPSGKPRTSIMDIIKHLMPQGQKRLSGEVPVEIYVKGEGKVIDDVIAGDSDAVLKAPKSDSGNSTMSKEQLTASKDACLSDSLDSDDDQTNKPLLLDNEMINDRIPMSEDSLDDDETKTIETNLDASAQSNSFFLSDDSSRQSGSCKQQPSSQLKPLWPPADNYTTMLPDDPSCEWNNMPAQEPDFVDIMSDGRSSDWSTTSKRARWIEKTR